MLTLVSVSAEQVTERFRIHEAEVASRKRLAELQADASAWRSVVRAKGAALRVQSWCSR
jgi:hypothetical protein